MKGEKKELSLAARAQQNLEDQKQKRPSICADCAAKKRKVDPKNKVEVWGWGKRRSGVHDSGDFWKRVTGSVGTDEWRTSADGPP